MKICALAEGDEQRAADLIHRSLVEWYEKNLGQGNRFGNRWEPFLLFPKVYAELDPGEALAAYDEKDCLWGVCFVHSRPTHVAVGIVATDPVAAGRGVARALLERVLARADQEGKPVRLVSSLWSLDSYSLYTRLGFRPGAVYQDIQFHVPETGWKAARPIAAERVRLATPQDIPKIARFERQLRGIDREKDWLFFVEKRVLDWEVWVLEAFSGALNGVLVSPQHPDWSMIGPGLARDADTAEALVWRALDVRRGKSTVLLVPARESELVRRFYGWGGRNIELHVAQVRGAEFPETGIAFPTFLPETA